MMKIWNYDGSQASDAFEVPHIPYIEQFSSPNSNAISEYMFFRCHTEVIPLNTILHVEMICHFRVPTAYSTQLQSINSFELIYTLSGKAHLNYLGHDYEIKAQDVFLIDCKNPYHYYNGFEEPWEFISIHFNGASAQDYFSYLLKANGIVSSLDHNSYFYRNLMMLLTIENEEIPHYEIVAANLLTNIITELIATLPQRNNTELILPVWISEARLYIENHFQEKITLDDLADRYALSKSHFSREFKKFLGYSPIEYLIKMRMNFAKSLLQFSSLSIEEIAYACGMNGANHFTQLFKKTESITPSAYRRSVLHDS